MNYFSTFLLKNEENKDSHITYIDVVFRNEGSSESLVPKIVGLEELLTISSFELLFDRYSNIPNLTKSIDVILIRYNDNTESSSISTKGESRHSSSINDESWESLVDTTLSIIKMLLLGRIPV
ncbi:hypothetical protein H8356DRAFT_1345073 [Neocallimastix lanati (nom. inval.)]|nr:hypothetical protein H8356DRAFT_1345073 [Neocallimastix sp. JGI-2020a]